MSTKLFFRRRWYLNIVLLVVLLFTPGSSSVIASSPCLDTFCYFLPYISVPAPVTITETNTYRWLGGGMRVTGEVVTTFQQPVYNLEIEVRAYDYANQLMDIGSGTPVFTATLPGQINPFDIYLPFEAGNVNYLIVEPSSWTLTTTQIYVAPTIVAISDVSNTGEVVTTIRNDNLQPLIRVYGVLWTLDQLFSISPILVTDYLAPGETAVFTYTISAAPFNIAVQGQGITEP